MIKKYTRGKNPNSRIGGFKKGHKVSEELRKKLSKANKGKIPWNKGLKCPKFSGENHPMYGKHHTEKAREKIRKAGIGRKQSEKSKEKLSETLRKLYKNGFNPVLGKHWELSEEHKRKIGKANSGKNSSNWKGGITPENQRIRHSIEYKLWREAVFARDNWTCQKCKQRGGKEIHSHHINNFAQYLELRTSIENGITFCIDCHREFHKIYKKRNNTREQLHKFLDHSKNKCRISKRVDV